MKSGNLNFLEPSGPLQACNGAALAFLLVILVDSLIQLSSLISHVPHSWHCLLVSTLNTTPPLSIPTPLTSTLPLHGNKN